MLKYPDAYRVARAALEKPHDLEWSLQGFGMLRVYLSDTDRLHVWDSRFRARGVSTIHTHPWNFESLVVAGVIANRRYYLAPRLEGGATHVASMLKCGEGGGLVGIPWTVAVLPATPRPEVYPYGARYVQRAAEVHESNAADGTVTLVRRRFLEDPDHATVAWPKGETWGSAEPRRATREEVEAITSSALRWWF